MCFSYQRNSWSDGSVSACERQKLLIRLAANEIQFRIKNRHQLHQKRFKNKLKSSFIIHDNKSIERGLVLIQNTQRKRRKLGVIVNFPGPLCQKRNSIFWSTWIDCTKSFQMKKVSKEQNENCLFILSAKAKLFNSTRKSDARKCCFFEYQLNRLFLDIDFLLEQ